MEGQVFSYSIVSGFTLALLYIVYRIFMARAKQPRLNRILLLGICGLSFLVVPCADALMSAYRPEDKDLLVKLNEMRFAGRGYEGSTSHLTPLNVDKVSMNKAAKIRMEKCNGIIIRFLLRVYFGGMIFCFLRWGISMLRLLILIRRSERRALGDAVLVITKKGRRGSPFSFGRYVVMSRDVYESEEASMVLQHELMHVRRNHWIDLVIVHLCVWVCWYNPFVWMFVKTMKDAHEYEVDASMIEASVDPSDYQMMLIKRVGGARLQPYADNLNHSKLKLRITMMQKSNSNLKRRLCAVALLPTAALALLLMQTPSMAAILNRFENSSAFDGKDTYYFRNKKEIKDFSDAFYDEENENLEKYEKNQMYRSIDEGDVLEDAEKIAKEEGADKTPASEAAEGKEEENPNELPLVYVDGIYMGKGVESIKNLNPSDIGEMKIDKSHGDIRIYIETKADSGYRPKDVKEGDLDVKLLNFNNYDGGVNVEVEITGTTSLGVSRCRLVNDGQSYEAKSMTMDGTDDIFVLKAKFAKMTKFHNVSLILDTDKGNYSCPIISTAMTI